MAFSKRDKCAIAEEFVKPVAKLRTYMLLGKKKNTLLAKSLCQMTLLNAP